MLGGRSYLYASYAVTARPMQIRSKAFCSPAQTQPRPVSRLRSLHRPHRISRVRPSGSSRSQAKPGTHLPGIPKPAGEGWESCARRFLSFFPGGWGWGEPRDLRWEVLREFPCFPRAGAPRNADSLPPPALPCLPTYLCYLPAQEAAVPPGAPPGRFLLAFSAGCPAAPSPETPPLPAPCPAQWGGEAARLTLPAPLSCRRPPPPRGHRDSCQAISDRAGRICALWLGVKLLRTSTPWCESNPSPLQVTE